MIYHFYSKRSPAGKRLGVKKFGGEEVQPGDILVSIFLEINLSYYFIDQTKRFEI